MDAYVNLKRIGKNVLLCMCDAEILGRTLRQGKITFCVKENFYRGPLVNVEEAVALIESSTIVNMIGKNIVKKAIEKGYVHPEAVLNIDGIPHAQIVKF